MQLEGTSWRAFFLILALRKIRCNCVGGKIPGRPGRLKIETSRFSIDVEHFSREK